MGEVADDESHNNLTRSLIRAYSVRTIEEIRSVGIKLQAKLTESKGTGHKNCSPELNEEKKYIYLPSTVFTEDYLAGWLLVTLARQHRFEVRTYPYTEEIDMINDDNTKLATGISLGMLDR